MITTTKIFTNDIVTNHGFGMATMSITMIMKVFLQF
jgi:hypothetical protein